MVTPDELREYAKYEDEQNASILQEAADEIERLELRLKNAVNDACEEDDLVRSLAKTVLHPSHVDGDSYCVPTVGDIVELLVKYIKVHET